MSSWTRDVLVDSKLGVRTFTWVTLIVIQGKISQETKLEDGDLVSELYSDD